MKKVLILANHFVTLHAFRQELINMLLEENYEVYLALPPSKDNIFFSRLGCHIIDISIDRRGTNPLSDLKLLYDYTKAIKKIQPDLILTYTIKPNTYGGIAARLHKKSVIHTVTGLGSVYIRDMWQSKIAATLNKFAFEKAETIVFLNEHNREFYRTQKIIDKSNHTMVVAGSGVNLEKFKYSPENSHYPITFTFIGRVLKDKGIDEYLIAAKNIVNKHRDISFEVVGFIDEEKYEKLLVEYEKNGIIKYLGKREDIASIIANSSCIVLPSYGEGRGTVLQEGAAIGRPLITTNSYGCRENVDDGYNGFLCKVGNANSLELAMEKFINLSSSERLLMGKRSREKAEKEFDRKQVVNGYFNEIETFFKGE